MSRYSWICVDDDEDVLTQETVFSEECADAKQRNIIREMHTVRSNNPTIIVGNDPGAGHTSKSNPLYSSKGGLHVIRAFSSAFAETEEDTMAFLRTTTPADVSSKKRPNTHKIRADAKALCLMIFKAAKAAYQSTPPKELKIISYGILIDMLVLTPAIHNDHAYIFQTTISQP